MKYEYLRVLDGFANHVPSFLQAASPAVSVVVVVTFLLDVMLPLEPCVDAGSASTAGTIAAHAAKMTEERIVKKTDAEMKVQRTLVPLAPYAVPAAYVPSSF